MAASGSTLMPGFSTFCSSTSTLPASTRACARSREGTRPRSTNNLSRRTLPADLIFVGDGRLDSKVSPKAVQRAKNERLPLACKFNQLLFHRVTHKFVENPAPLLPSLPPRGFHSDGLK